jgi:hypothetical protein
MARPRFDSPLDLFTATELGVGGGTTRRNILLIDEKGRVPFAPTPKDESHRVGDIRTLKHIAVIAAFQKAGIDLLLSLKLVAPIADELEINYSEIPSNLDRYMEKPLHTGPGDFPWEHQEGDPDSRNDFWFHHLLLTRTPTVYRRGKSMLGDFVIEVADRKYVYMDVIRKPESIPVYAGVHYSADPLFKVIGWERGEDAEILPFHHEVANMGRFFDETEREREGHLHAEYLDAYAHATGRIRVNISLAIRNALDAIHDRRVRQGMIAEEIERRDDSPVP